MISGRYGEPVDSEHRNAVSQLLDDPAAIAALRCRLLHYAQRSLSEADAEDVTQETLLALLAAHNRYDGTAQMETYAHAVLRHKTIDVYRAHGREVPCEPEALQAVLEESEVADDPAHQLHARRQARSFWTTLNRCLRGLPERTRAMFELRELLEVDLAVASRQLGISCNHASVLAHRARAELRRRWPGALQ